MVDLLTWEMLENLMLVNLIKKENQRYGYDIIDRLHFR